MRRFSMWVLIPVVAATLLFVSRAGAQTPGAQPTRPAADQKAAQPSRPVAQADYKAGKADVKVDATAPQAEEKTYVVVAASQLERTPEIYAGSYVQLPDSFQQQVDPAKFPPALASYGITPRTYYGFLTHKVLGSRMICFVSRDSKEAQEFFNTPLTPETEIYIMGRVGTRIDTAYGPLTFMLVDRVTRGGMAPAPIVEEKKKPVSFKLEWQTENGTTKSQTYTIPEPGKKYIIPDPYDPSRKMYMTFDF